MKVVRSERHVVQAGLSAAERGGGSRKSNEAMDVDEEDEKVDT